ncbi:unnamed protein product [Mesocestoides corti]|uniref:BZIP domain-containing protein n=1 Tax=Mesocestoides corti TaxID=53468 RepID=A0A0R3UGL8_MESCO|nr:unnamed protein product [Mesocestoides corti]
MSNNGYALQQTTTAGVIKLEPTLSSGAKPTRGKPTSALHMEEEKYIALRKRNNIAVRKSREKQRAKQNEVIKTLSILRDENSTLQSTVAARIRELNLLNSLLKQVNHTPPKRLSKILNAYNAEQFQEMFCDNKVDTPTSQSSTSSTFSSSSSPQSIPSSSAASRLISFTAYRQQE